MCRENGEGERSNISVIQQQMMHLVINASRGDVGLMICQYKSLLCLTKGTKNCTDSNPSIADSAIFKMSYELILSTPHW